MNIEKYCAYFHDGSLIDIRHEGNRIELFMISAEVDPDDIEGIPVSDVIWPNGKMFLLKGKLCLEGVKSISIDEKPYNVPLVLFSDNGNIFHFKIAKNKVELQIIWERFNPKPIEDIGFSIIEIESETIDWEPLPDLNDI